MDFATIMWIVNSIITAFVIYVLLKLAREFKTLLNIVGGLKFRVFEHESQLLGRRGVYVPEDVAEYIFNVVWTMITDKEKAELEKKYKESCPEHIPMWKYILYNYRVDIKLIPKEPFMNIDSPQDILLGRLEQLEQILNKAEIIDKKLEQVKNEIGSEK